MKSPITTHVLDTTRGTPAEGVLVALEMQQSDGRWKELGRGTTNSDGRLTDLLPEGHRPVHGTYRLIFFTAEYFSLLNVDSFYSRVAIEFVVGNSEHYHVPLLLSPFGYSTYRGS